MFKILQNNISPVAVGALGGSGTRVVAEILMQAGVYMGNNLNNANDNLTFTCLFKRSEWYSKSNQQQRIELLKLFEKMMREEPLTVEQKMAYAGAYLRNWNYTLKNKIKAPFRTREDKTYKAWGWKEPNTHVYINELAELFPDFRYIHVIRDGRDMAFSSNTQQLKNWGRLYDVDLPQNKEEWPAAQLEYWIKANHNAINVAEKRLKDRFYLLKFEELCKEPVDSIQELLYFLGLDLPVERVKELSLLPKLPSSTGRYKKTNMKLFTARQLEAVEELGYKNDEEALKTLNN